MYPNDTRIATWRFRFEQSAGLPAEISVPRRVLRNSGIAFLTFVISSPRSPAKFHVSDDTLSDCTFVQLRSTPAARPTASSSKARQRRISFLTETRESNRSQSRAING